MRNRVRILAGAAGAILLVPLIAVPGVASTCPAHDSSRVRPPDNFVLEVCATGNDTVELTNRSSLVVRIEPSGHNGVTRTYANGNIASMIIGFKEPSAAVLPPGSKAVVKLGPGAARIRVEGHTRNEEYALWHFFFSIVPNIGIPDDFIAFLDEIYLAAREVSACLNRNGFLGDAGCRAEFVWDVSYAVGRLAVKMGPEFLRGTLKGTSLGIALSLLDYVVTDLPKAVEDARKFLVTGSRTLEIPAIQAEPPREAEPARPSAPEPPIVKPISPKAPPQPQPQPPANVQPNPQPAPASGCQAFVVYSQNRWDPRGTALRAAPDHNSTKVGGFAGNTAITVNGWTHGSTPYPNNPAPFNSDLWYRVADGRGWISFPGVRGAPTDYAPNSPDGGPPAPVPDGCQV